MQVPIYLHGDLSLIKDEQFKLALVKQCNGYIRFDQQVTSSKPSIPRGLYTQVYVSAVKPGERFVDETSLLHID